MPLREHLQPGMRLSPFAGDDMVSLADRPAHFVFWDGLTYSPEILQAIAKLGIASAEFEDTCHFVYWKYARLNAITGPIVTESLSPNRLTEDILKFANEIERNKRRTEDLRRIFASYKKVAQERNSCIHWLWVPMVGDQGYVVRPMYKGPGPGKAFSAAAIYELACDMAWLQVRLHTHLLTDKFIRSKRAKLWPAEAVVSAPAPWLDKLPRPDPKRSKPRATRK
jgi:hypothetical protein